MSSLPDDTSFTPISSSSPQPLSSQCLTAAIATWLGSFYKKNPFAHCFQNLVLCLVTGVVNFSLASKVCSFFFPHTKVFMVFHKNSRHTNQSKVDVHVYRHCRSESGQPSASGLVVEQYFRIYRDKCSIVGTSNKLRQNPNLLYRHLEPAQNLFNFRGHTSEILCSLSVPIYYNLQLIT